MRRLFLGVVRVFTRCGLFAVSSRSSVDFIELLGAFWTFEFMTLARHSKCRNGQKQNGEKFHSAVS